jgi:anti-anti-sigma regulatory factor
MLKITETSKEEKTVTLRLDGKISDDWIRELERVCLHYRDEENKIVVLDFLGVIFIDDNGVRMLEKIKDNRIRIINCSLFIQSLLSNLVNSDKR